MLFSLKRQLLSWKKSGFVKICDVYVLFVNLNNLTDKRHINNEAAIRRHPKIDPTTMKIWQSSIPLFANSSFCSMVESKDGVGLETAQRCVWTWSRSVTIKLFVVCRHSVLERIWVKGSYLSQWLPQGERGPPKESKSRCIEILHVGSH